MGQAVQLENFALAAAVQAHPTPNWNPTAFRKEAFDEGYAAGWDDAVKQTQSDAAKAEAQISAALQTLDFTYFEARHHVLASLRPLIDAMMNSVLPNAAKEALIPLAVAELEALAKKTEAPIELRCAAETADRLQAHLATNSSTPARVVVEDTLTDAQIRVCWAEGDWMLDTHAAQTRINEAVTQFFAPDMQEGAKHA